MHTLGRSNLSAWSREVLLSSELTPLQILTLLAVQTSKLWAAESPPSTELNPRPGNLGALSHSQELRKHPDG